MGSSIFPWFTDFKSYQSNNRDIYTEKEKRKVMYITLMLCYVHQTGCDVDKSH